MKTVLRFVGGPYDGWEIPATHTPHPYLCFAGPPAPWHTFHGFDPCEHPCCASGWIPRVDYERRFAYEDSKRSIHVYSFRGMA